MTNLILLAAGRGSRLGEMTSELPKALNLYKNKPILDYILKNIELSENIFSKLVIVGGYKVDMFSRFDCDLIENSQWQNSGPLFSLSLAQKYLESDQCIVSYTDIIYDVKYWDSIYRLNEEIVVPSNQNFLNSWKSRSVNIEDDLETFKIEDGYISEIGQRIENIEEVKGQFAGIVKFTPSGWSRFSKVVCNGDYRKKDITNALNEYVNAGGKIRVHNVDAYWQEFDNPQDFEI
jgi:choline kinase